MSKSIIVMVGPSLQSCGGISAVVNTYRRAGLFDRWKVAYVAANSDANALGKAAAALIGFSRFVFLLVRGKVRVLHVHSASRWSFVRKSLFVLLALMCGKPVIFQLHGGEFINIYENELGAISRFYVRFVLNKCSRIIVLSKNWKSMMLRIVKAESIRVIMNPVDADIAVGPDNERHSNVLLFLGRLEEQKGVYILLDAVSQLKAKLNVRLLLCGTGNSASFERRIDQLGIRDRVETLGWVEGTIKKELLATATAFVLPSFAEGLPMSILEAMAYGTPVISTPVGGIPDVVDDGVNGLLVPPGDSKRLGKAISFLLENPDIAKHMGTQGRKKFESCFNSNVIIPQVESLYAELGLHPAG